MNVIIFGASGMVGAGVLIECLEDARIERVLVVGRNSCGVTHPKLREIVRANLADYSDTRESFRGLDACFYCLGVTSVGMDEAAYSRVTYDLTVAAAKPLAELNPRMTFCFVSGQNTDSTEKGPVMWARVKGRAENAIFAMGFRGFAFRPGYIQPRKGVTSRTALYRFFYVVLAPLYPVLRIPFGKYMTTSDAVGQAMINIAAGRDSPRILDNAAINEAAKRP
jgi:uncharacterized protein YbjT (DUF2867 family)